MCLAVPVEVIELLDHDQALVNIGGIKSRVSLALVDDVEVGDYVIAHVGHAITRLDVKEAERTLELFREISDHLAAEANAPRQ